MGDFSFGATTGLLALPAAQNLSSMLVEEEDEEDEDEEDDRQSATSQRRANTVTGTVWPANGR